MRSHDDAAVIADTLRMLHRQDYPFELLVLDNQSTDGTLQEVRRYTDRVLTVSDYVPGRVLNQGMRHTQGEVVVFLNSDATPQDESWLRNLLAPFTDPSVAAAFSRQIPRPDCWPLYAKDTEDTYGDGSRHSYWRNCFSMASSAVRRSVWDRIQFNEQLQISEDIDWTWRARRQGRTVRYVPDSVVMHSHNYTWRQFCTRQFKEGRDEALIFEWSAWRRSFLRYALLPYARQVLGDWRYFLPRLGFGALTYAPVLRMAQLAARRAGFRRGLKERSQ